MFNMRKIIFGSILVLLFSYWAIRPLFTSGFFPMHDDTQIARVVAMGRALRNGQFPVRWVSELGYGYGYPIFNFYGPLPYYVGGGLYALGLSGLTATKLMFALGIMGAGVAMYLTSLTFLGHVGAMVASAFYMYAPYHAVQIYVRGSVGEFWVLIFLPFLFWGFLSKSKLIGGIGLAGIILSHTLLGYATTTLLIVGLVGYWIIRRLLQHFDWSLVIGHWSLILIGLGLSAFFWLPAITEIAYTNVREQISATANYMDHFVCLSQLWNSMWGFGGSTAGCLDGISFKLGKIHVIVAAAGLALLWINRQKTLFSYALTALGITLAAVALLLHFSIPLWNTLPRLAYLQYPWRFLTFAIFGLSALSGTIVACSRNTIVRFGVASACIAAVIVLNAKWFAPQYVYPKNLESFETSEELRWRVSKISDEYLPPAVVRPRALPEVPQGAILPRGDLEVETERENEIYAKFALLSTISQPVTIHRAYFPGWRYWVNGVETLSHLADGLPVLSVPQGRSVVEMRLTNTPVRTLGNVLSAVTVILLLYVYGKKIHS